MAKFLDSNGLSHLWGIIKNYVADAVSTKVDKTTTVNSHPLSGNVTVTKEDVGLGNVKNAAQVLRSEMGAKSGVATLDSSGKVPSSQLPSYVDDVLEYASKANFPSAGETGKIYVSTSDNKTWRWSGSAYVEISQGVTLGETSSTAYAGDKGKKTTDIVNSIVNNVGVIVEHINIGTKSSAGIQIEYSAHNYNPDTGLFDQDSSAAFYLPAAETTIAGLMSAADKKKLDGIATGATADSALSTSEIDQVCV